MTKRTADLNKLFEIILAFNSETSYFGLLEAILSKLMELTSADAGTLYMVDNNLLRFKIMRNITLGTYQSAYEEINLPPILLDEKNIENVSAYCAIKNELISIDDVYYSDQFNFSGPKKYDQITGYRTGSMLVLPLSTTEGDVIGVLQLMNSMDAETNHFTSFEGLCDLSILRALANISANALSNIIYAKEIEDLFSSFVRVVTAGIDERSTYTTNHTQNVARYCERLTDYMRTIYPEEHPFHFDDKDKQQLIMAAFLHDMGKLITPLEVMDKADRLSSRREVIMLRFSLRQAQLETDYAKNVLTGEQYEAGIRALQEARALTDSANIAGFLPNDTLDKVRGLAVFTYRNDTGEDVPIFSGTDMDAITVQKGTLTDAERFTMQEHVIITGRLLDQMGFDKHYTSVPFWARSHHEFLDGTGYPLGLTEKSLCPQVFILTIADIFDALAANDRPYKKAMPPEKAISILRQMAEEGKLHKELVERFAESMDWQG